MSTVPCCRCATGDCLDFGYWRHFASIPCGYHLHAMCSLVGIAGYAAAVAGIHPYELTYFNTIAGGPLGGRRILADSNLDWGQGLKSLARLQQERPDSRT